MYGANSDLCLRFAQMQKSGFLITLLSLKIKLTLIHQADCWLSPVLLLQQSYLPVMSHATSRGHRSALVALHDL